MGKSSIKDKQKPDVQSNFAFLKDTDIYDNSEIYRRICDNARLAEGSYFINSDIFNFYVRKTVELVCKFIEISKKLNICTKYNKGKKTIGTYLLDENLFEFLPAVGGLNNYNRIKNINNSVSLSAHENYDVTPNEISEKEIITDFYGLMVWFYKEYGGTQDVMLGDFDEERIPFEPDTHFFFKDYDNNIDVTERDRRYLESISHKENIITVQKEDDKILVTDSASGKKEYYYHEEYHKDVVSKEENLVNEYKDKVKKLDEVISNLKNENDEKESQWYAEKQRIVNELQQLAGKYDSESESSRNIILELEKRLEAEEKQHNNIIADYTESINAFKSRITDLSKQCDEYKEQSGQLEEITIAYEDLKAEYSAIKYQLNMQKKQLPAPVNVNEVATEVKNEGLEKLIGYLLQLKWYYDEKERNYNSEIERIRKERDIYRQQCENNIRQNLPEQQKDKSDEADKTKTQKTKTDKTKTKNIKKKPDLFLKLIIANSIFFAGVLIVVFLVVSREKENNSQYKNTSKAASVSVNENQIGTSDTLSVAETKNDAIGNGSSSSVKKDDFKASASEDTNTRKEDDTAHSEDKLRQIKQQAVSSPDSIESVNGVNADLITEINKLDIKSISVYTEKTRRNNMEYIGKAVVPGLTKNGYSLHIMGDDDTEHNLCNMIDNKVIRFAYCSGNRMGYVMAAVEINDVSDKLGRYSTIDDVRKVLGEEQLSYERSMPTSFSDASKEIEYVFKLEKGGAVVVLTDKDGKVCDYAYIATQMSA